MKLSCDAVGKYIVFASLLTIILFAGVAKAADTDQERTCVLAAEKWLALVDAGSFMDSWEASAEALKARINQLSWVQKLRSEREPNGICISRRFIAARYRDYPPGSDKDERLIIRFNTSFQNKKFAVERVAVAHDKDGQWRVAAYRITPNLPNLQDVLIALLLLVVVIGLWLIELNPRMGPATGGDFEGK